jgi:hypothetical protein
MVQGLLNVWVGDMMDESLSSMGRWLKTIMKLAIAVAEQGTELVEKISNN